MGYMRGVADECEWQGTDICFTKRSIYGIYVLVYE